MSKGPVARVIRLRGVRQNNLKNFDLDLPLGKLIVFTGLSGSGKSSLAFDTLFAEGQRRYIETFSPYARQFLDRMDKPKVDSIEGIPPAIAIEQRNTVKSTRSTVGTMTEIVDYTKLFWPHLAQLFCRNCGELVQKDSPQRIWEVVRETNKGTEVFITFDLPLSDKFSFEESLALIAKQGYQRLLVGSEYVRLEDVASKLGGSTPKLVTVLQDRVKVSDENRSRFIEACEQAYHFGKGHLAIRGAKTKLFSNKFHCADCNLEYREPSAALFSFNHPIGACPTCRGFGRIITIDYNAAIPDRSKTLAGGAVNPWQTGQGAESQDDLAKFAKTRHVPMDVPFEKLPQKFQDWVINGDPGYGKDEAHRWPKFWYGVKGYFKWLESKAYKMHVRVLLSRYRSYQTCPDCHGARFQPDSLLYRLQGKSVGDFYKLTVREALEFVNAIAGTRKHLKRTDPINLALHEVCSRLGYLDDVGLGYLTLDRSTRSLSGGETERVNLTTCLGSCLVNTLFVLDEPSVGLHPRDTERLVKIVERLRSVGNTVVVVEHEAGVIRAADLVVDIGPGHGESGGHVVFQGTVPELLQSKESLTGQYLSGARTIEVPARRTGKDCAWLKLEHASTHNLRDLTIEIPLGRFVAITGVSGSGKTTLMREVLLPALEAKLNQQPQAPVNRDVEEKESDEDEGTAKYSFASISGWERFSRVVLVDQSPLGRTPRSNPAVYIGAFEDIRILFAQSETAKQRGLNASAFSFNSAQGQCERCRGAGFEKIEMQFLSDVFIRCPDCDGRRYRPHILEVKLSAPGSTREWSIGDVLEATVDEVVDFLSAFSDSAQAKRAANGLKLLQETGLGYLRLGQPVTTLSGGESQRLKLVSHLAEVEGAGAKQDAKPILFLFDEPTTGLHFEDVRVLLKVFQRLVDAGHSVVVIEHNLEVIKSADWVIDLGPDAGEDGGRIVAEGTPEDVAQIPGSYTGRFLADVLKP
jgi:excinuclease ABC subunit A